MSRPLFAVARERRLQQVEANRTPQAAEEILSGSELIRGMAGSTAQLPGDLRMESRGAQFK